MVTKVVFTESFRKAVHKLKDAAVKERINKQVAEIVQRPDIGKPLKFQKKGDRSVWLPPFRIIYAIDGDTLFFLDFDKRDRVYR